MSVLTIRLWGDKHERLKELAKAKGISVNKLIEDLSTITLTEFDAETKFRVMASQGNIEEGLAILDKLDCYFDTAE